MNQYINIPIDFFETLPVKKLKRKCGYEAIILYQKMIIWAASHSPSGHIPVQYFEEKEDWADESKKNFLDYFIQLELIQKLNESTYYIANWANTQPHIAFAKERSDKGRLSRLTAISPQDYLKFREEGRKGISSEEYSACTS